MTLIDYANRLAEISGGTIVYNLPQYATVTTPDGRDVLLPGEAFRGWENQCKLIIEHTPIFTSAEIDRFERAKAIANETGAVVKDYIEALNRGYIQITLANRLRDVPKGEPAG